MRTLFALIVGALTIFALVAPCLMSHHSFSKSQSIDDKELYSHKKNGYNKDKKQDYFARYQDWDEDWSNEDMMQHPIDESPRKVIS